MTQTFTLTMAEKEQMELMAHLFPGDSKESAAIGLCSLGASKNPVRVLVKEIVPVPVEVCTLRTPVAIQWPFEWLDPLLSRAAAAGLSVVKFHCHPGNQAYFSEIDDVGDDIFFENLHGYLDNDAPHASVVVMPSGQMLGRVGLPDGSQRAIAQIGIAGRQPQFWWCDTQSDSSTTLGTVGRHSRGFGQEMRSELRRLSIGIVGVSGTGSIVAEQCARLGFGRIILVDPQRVETRNLDRIVSANAADARAGTHKVVVAKRAIDALGFGTEVVAIPANIVDRDAVVALASCDVLGGCVDGAEGRAILDRLVASQLQPLVDVGVGAVADDDGAIDQIDTAVNFVVPGGSSLLSRGVYTSEQVHAENLARVAPEEYARQRAEKYIKGRDEEQPAVISINMIAAASAVLELIARLYPFRHNTNLAAFDAVRMNLAEVEFTIETYEKPCPVMGKLLAIGGREPLLNMPQLSRKS
ncbi:JAB domain-containing protein similar to deubiquitination enzymes [Novosphingobium kunmingense]|uniref:JAB domain-containing protein similar to deubiquitination enzymes n=2 Tax=Novosphingobium kunmingense TaxID=1211806 RepID=A0A2N0H7J5_9SPHN|nr:JAB domain-containing protein similar to deubiquitination enzymes [Novosphingobium kunmingense]